MDDRDRLAAEFEEHRPRLRGVAYRMLGSAKEADDAVQETWLRLSGSNDDIENLGGWLTTAVGRVCLNMLRSRGRRPEAPLDDREPIATGAGGSDPADDAVLAESVGLAMLVVLDRLRPPERLAFVLHDTFSVPFEEIAELLDKTPAAVRQLASRARRRVEGAPVPEVDVARQREVADAYLAAVRGADFDALLAVLDADVVLHADREAGPTPKPLRLVGAGAVAKGAMASVGRAGRAELALVGGAVGLVTATDGRLSLALAFTYSDGRIAGIDVVADPQRLAELDVAPLP